MTRKTLVNKQDCLTFPSTPSETPEVPCYPALSTSPRMGCLSDVLETQVLDFSLNQDQNSISQTQLTYTL